MNSRLAIGAVALLLALVLAFTLWPKQKSPDSTKVVIAEGNQPIAAPVYVAFSKGFFKEEGLNVELASFPTGKLCLDAVIGGKADFATAAETPIMHAAFKAIPIRIVATMHRSRFNTYLVARKDSDPTNDIAGLKGQAIGVPIGTNAEYALAAFLAKHSLPPGQFKIINLSPPEMIGPLARGDVAAVVGWQPHIGRSERALKDNSLRFSLDEVYEETYNIVASSETTDGKPEVVTKILKALDRAIAYMNDNPADAIKIVSERIGMDSDELDQLWTIYHFGLDLRESLVETLVSEGNWAIESGHQQGHLPEMRSLISPKALRSFKPNAVEIP